MTPGGLFIFPADVRYWHKADIGLRGRNVSFLGAARIAWPVENARLNLCSVTRDTEAGVRGVYGLNAGTRNLGRGTK